MAKRLISLYPSKRSALLPLCHLAQEQDGYLSPEMIREIADLLDLEEAQVSSTASFYDMYFLEPVGKYVINVCTNVACMLDGAYELLAVISKELGIEVGETTLDKLFTLEEAECLAYCDKAPCLQVNHRYFGPMDEVKFKKLVEGLRNGSLDSEIPRHGVLIRNKRRKPLVANMDEVLNERALMDDAIERRKGD